MTKVEVLDHGFVEYLDHMGSDRGNAEGGWTSTGKCEGREDWEVERVVNFMGREGHWTALAQNSVKLRIHMPVFVARQLMKSNVGFVWNEESRRMTSDNIQYYEHKEWCGPPTGKSRQGRGDPLCEESQRVCRLILNETTQKCIRSYNELLTEGCSMEEARMVLPFNLYTTTVFSASLVAVARLYGLRTGEHAQKESQQYAHAIAEIVEPLFPVSWKALTGGGSESTSV